MAASITSTLILTVIFSLLLAQFIKTLTNWLLNYIIYDTAYTLSTTSITQTIVPLTFPHEQTFGNPLNHAKPPGHIHLAFCNVAGFPIDAHNNSRFRTFGLSKPNLRLISLAVVKVISTGKRCHWLANFMNGSALTTPSAQSQAITSTMTLVYNNMVAPSF